VAFRPDHAGIVNALTYDMALATCIVTRVERSGRLSGARIVPEPTFAAHFTSGVSARACDSEFGLMGF
jgi:hypothetical protein